MSLTRTPTILSRPIKYMDVLPLEGTDT